VLSGATNVSSRARAAVEAAAKVRFADISAAETVGPALTTVRQPIAEIGDTMADLVIGRTSGEETTRETILPVELILRDTA
jgi:DNA-binding LacI/PurR family transcriptional regulator